MSGRFPGLSFTPALREIAERVNGLLRGKLNAVTTVTLTPGSATTVLTDSRLTAFSYVGLSPTTANAAAEHAFVTAKTSGTCTLVHTANAATDRTYDVLIIG